MLLFHCLLLSDGDVVTGAEPSPLLMGTVAAAAAATAWTPNCWSDEPKEVIFFPRMNGVDYNGYTVEF